MATKVDRERLRSLVEPHWRRLYNFVFRLTLDRDRAERYLVDIFAQAAEQIEQMPDTDAEIWLLGIGNHLLRYRRWLTGDVDDDLAVTSDLDLRNLKARRLDGFDRAADFNGFELPIAAAHGRTPLL